MGAGWGVEGGTGALVNVLCVSRMRQLVVLAVMVALAAASPRERRSDILLEYDKCRGGAGVCVPYYLCQNDTVVTDGAGIIDIR